MNRDANRASDAGRTDAELVLAARRGEKRAFVEIVARHQAMVCGIALGILSDFAASEDAGQEAFLTAWRKIHELRDPERLRQWLRQIARNAALGHLRRKRGEAPLEMAEVLPDEGPAPDEVAATEEEAELVRDSLAKLPELYRLPLILFYREGQSVRAVAESLSISEDAVKQRLARGREMLRDRMSGLVETVLTRSTPTAVFTMAIAAAIGALAAPAVMAGAVFATASAASTSTSASILTAMSTSKTVLATAAVVTAICIPVGYYVSSEHASPVRDGATQEERAETADRLVSAPNFDNSALFREWQELHDKHGRTAEAMPAIYKSIADMKDPFRRRAFRAALIAEWVQLDARGGLAFLIERKSDSMQRRQFLEEWLSQDARSAVDALLAGGPGWEGMARDNLSEIARRVPGRLGEIVSRLPKSDSYWDTKVRDAFAVMADGGLSSARAAAEKIDGPNRDQALAGVAQAWGKSDLKGALAWAKSLPDGTDRDEIIRTALVGKAAVEPAAALDLAGLVPPGGKDHYFATTTGARILSAAAKSDYDATVAWLAAHPGRMGGEDLMGLAQTVTDRLNADPVSFLAAHAADGSLSAILPAISSALLNAAAGQRPAVWEWLKAQPESETIKSVKEQVLRSAGWQDPELAMRLVNDVPQTAQGDEDLKNIARSLFNGGSRLHQFDKFLEQAPERLRAVLCEEAFNCLHGESMDDPQRWIARLSHLPEGSQSRATEAIARAWSQQRPEEAVQWAASLPESGTRVSAVAAAAANWAAQDAHGAAEWLSGLPPGTERDRSAQSFVYAVAEQYPRDAWDWALSIQDEGSRNASVTHVAKLVAARDPQTARQLLDSGPLPSEMRSALQAVIDSSSNRSSLK